MVRTPVPALRVAPALFPRGLRAFQRRLGLPLITHARWIDAHSPYRRRYAMSRNVSMMRV